MTRSTGSMVDLKAAALISSNRARVMLAEKSTPCGEKAHEQAQHQDSVPERASTPSFQSRLTSNNESTSTVVWVTEDKVLLARSQADFNLLTALTSLEMSSLFFLLNSCLKCSNKVLSKSSPPK